MTETLLSAELRTVSDVAELGAGKILELFVGLRSASVPLGDRSHLRKAARGVGCSRIDPIALEGGTDHSFVMEHHGSKVSQPAKVTWVGGSGHPAEEWQVTEHWKLQSGGGISIEVAAIVATGLIGMVG